MKKLFIALAVMAALTFSVAPSQALNSMPDDVPGCNPLTPFFLVAKSGISTPGVGLDTLFVVQEIGGGGTQFKTKGYLHLVLRNYKSAHVVDVTFPYTPNDVVPFSVKDILLTYLSASELAGLEITLNGQVYYTGYMDWENSLGVNNLVAFMYLIDLTNGWAAANTAPVFEIAPAALGFEARQYWTYTSDYYGTIQLEPFSATGLAVTQYRERGQTAPAGTAATFRLMPRYFLKDANAQTWIPIWSSTNKTTSTGAYTYPITCYLYDNDENVISKIINIPYELNWLDIRNLLATTGLWASVTGGWLDIPFPASGRYDVQWLAYSYQTASSSSIGASWSVLTAVHREAGTIPAAT